MGCDVWELWKYYVSLDDREEFLKGEKEATDWESERFHEASTEIDKEIWRAKILLKRLEYLQYWRSGG